MANKRVTDIIIAKNVASGEGFIRVLKDTQSALVAGNTIADSPLIYIEQEIAGGKKILSLPIHGSMVRNYSGRSGVSGTKAKITVSNINVLSDQEYGLYIHMFSDKEMAQGNRRYYAQYFSDSTATAVEIATGIRDSINATLGLKDLVTATISGSDIIIEASATNPYSNFNVGRAIGFDASITITQTTVHDPGIGTYDQALAMEELAKGYKGYMGERRTFVGNLPGFSRPTYFSAGSANSLTTVYDIYVIDHDQPFENQGFNDLEGKPTTTYILIPVGATTLPQATFEGILNPWMASTPGAFAPVNL